MEALQEIFDNLQNGKQYGCFYALRFPGFSTCLSLYKAYPTAANNFTYKKYIRWCHYGESANENTIKDLQWILENIFKMSAEKFLSTFEIYTNEKMKEWETIAAAQNTNDYRKWRFDK